MLVTLRNGQAAKRASVWYVTFCAEPFLRLCKQSSFSHSLCLLLRTVMTKPRRLSLFAAAHCVVKTREQHALTLDGVGGGLPPLALSMVQLEDGLPV